MKSRLWVLSCLVSELLEMMVERTVQRNWKIDHFFIKIHELSISLPNKQNLDEVFFIYIVIKISDRKSRRLDLSYVIFK